MNRDSAKPGPPSGPVVPADEPVAAMPSRPRAIYLHPVAWVVLAVSVVASAGGWLITREHAELGAQKQFDEEVNRIAASLTERMRIYQDVLHGAVGLYAASYSVEREEWRAYVQSVSIDERFPGIGGIGFIANVPRTNLDDFLKVTRADKTPDFTPKGLGPGNDFFIIKYIEPEDRHRGLLGRDVGAIPEQRLVAEQARDSGADIISGKLTLAETDGSGPQPGFLMMLPVYRHGAPTRTVEERRANIEGWVYARCATAQLMRGIFGKKSPMLTCEVFDGADLEAERLMFDSDPELHARQDGHVPQFSTTVPIQSGGRTWTLRFTTKHAFDAALPRGSEWLVGMAGGALSLLLFGIAWSLSTTRQRALAMASDMTAALRGANEQLRQAMQQRERAEQSIKDSEALYHSLVESLPLDIVRKDLHGRITFANRHFCMSLDRPLEAIVGKTDAELFPAALAGSHRHEDQRVIETGTILETVEEHTTAQGQRRFVQVIKTPVYDSQGGIVGLLGIQSDVTARHRAEEALRHEHFLLHTLMDNLPDRIYFKDLQSRFLRNNKAHLKLFGLDDAAQAIGKSDFDFFSEEHARQAFEDDQELIRGGVPVTKEEKETWPDASVTWVLSTKLPLRDEDGQIIGTFGISRDITDRRRAEDTMRQAKEIAEEASRAKSQFLASMSHELRTPLNSVIGFANILLKNKTGNLTPTELNFLERIVANGKHLLSLINQVLDLSKIEARKLEVQLSPVALEELVRGTIAQQEALLRDRPIQLLADIPDGLAPIQTDVEKLRQVLINLVGNALKFTEQGSVTVRVVADPANHVPSRLDVSDTGIGIPPEKLGPIFQAFQQAEAGTARKYGGTGLGLTISQALCHLMGYRIDVQSELGKGSTFSVIFGPSPDAAITLARAPTPLPPPAPTAAPDALKDKFVLVIDDEADSQTLLTHMVKEFGCRVMAASSGEQGLQMARQHRPDIITLDLLMPNMNGWQVLRAIRADAQLQAIPVLVVSVVAHENRGRILGPVDVLQKPVAREELLTVLQRNLCPPKRKVLIVDDDADTRRLLTSYLEDEHVEIRTAADGLEALAAMKADAPDLVLLDLMMPVMDGLSFLNEIRADPRYERLPVVVITAKELTADEARQLKQQSQQVWKKSAVFQADLRQLLRGLLSRATRGMVTGEHA